MNAERNKNRIVLIESVVFYVGVNVFEIVFVIVCNSVKGVKDGAN